MVVLGVTGAFVVGLTLGFLIHIRGVAKQAIREQLRAVGLTKDAATRYRQAAKILHDLVYASDLEEAIPILPPPLQKRIEDWIKAHREAIHNG